MILRKALLCAAILPLMAGCATLPPGTSFVRIDGKPAPKGSPGQAQFQTDRTICIGEASKASLGGGQVVVETGDPIYDGISEGLANGKRDRDVGAVFLGCMAGKGYRLDIPGQTSDATVKQ